VARLDPDTLELHYALGALFRRRGELDRAIRIHQNLIDRADLSQEHRLKALFELGVDFLKAGLLDRAEAVFRRLEGSNLALDALRNILDIQVLTKAWQEAIATAERLEKLGTPAQNADTAHYLCELAVGDLLREDTETARAHLDAALKQNPRSARAYLMRGDLEVRAGRDEEAIAHWRLIEDLNPVYLPLVVDRLAQAYARLGRQDEGLKLLRAYLDRSPSADLLHELFQIVVDRQGWDTARQLAAEALRRNPNLRVLDDWLRARNALGEVTVEASLAQDLIHRQVARLAFYQCTNCGFRARQFFWQCPACARWESIPPERTEHE